MCVECCQGILNFYIVSFLKMEFMWKVVVAMNIFTLVGLPATASFQLSAVGMSSDTPTRAI